MGARKRVLTRLAERLAAAEDYLEPVLAARQAQFDAVRPG